MRNFWIQLPLASLGRRDTNQGSRNRIVRKLLWSFICLLITHMPLFSQSSSDDVTGGPPLGWNSWDSYGMYPTEKAMLANAEAMAKRLKPFGYQYFVIDAGWNKMKDADGKIVSMSLDKTSRYIPNPATFPNGLKGVADRVHQLGMKFGIHIMRGISREAYRQNMPILGTSYTARTIADTTSLCKWNSDNYGVDMQKPGAQAFYDSHIALLADYGVDFIKADDICGHPDEIDAVIHGIKQSGREITLSLSPGGDSKPEYFSTYKKADMLRVTKDVWDDQVGIDRVFDAWKLWNGIDHSGFWLDMDMIPFGHLCLHNPDPGYRTATENPTLHGVKQMEHMSFFTDDQKVAFMTMRALCASPLMMGGDLPTSDERSFQLITDKDMLACNQNGVTGKQVYNKDGFEVWQTADKKNPKRGWFGIFNRNKINGTIQLSATAFGPAANAVQLRNIWEKKDEGKLDAATKTFQVKTGGALFYSYTIL